MGAPDQQVPSRIAANPVRGRQTAKGHPDPCKNGPGAMARQQHQTRGNMRTLPVTFRVGSIRLQRVHYSLVGLLINILEAGGTRRSHDPGLFMTIRNFPESAPRIEAPS